MHQPKAQRQGQAGLQQYENQRIRLRPAALQQNPPILLNQNCQRIDAENGLQGPGQPAKIVKHTGQTSDEIRRQ